MNSSPGSKNNSGTANLCRSFDGVKVNLFSPAKSPSKQNRKTQKTASTSPKLNRSSPKERTVRILKRYDPLPVISTPSDDMSILSNTSLYTILEDCPVVPYNGSPGLSISSPCSFRTVLDAKLSCRIEVLTAYDEATVFRVTLEKENEQVILYADEIIDFCKSFICTDASLLFEISFYDIVARMEASNVVASLEYLLLACETEQSVDVFKSRKPWQKAWLMDNVVTCNGCFDHNAPEWKHHN